METIEIDKRAYEDLLIHSNCENYDNTTLKTIQYCDVEYSNFFESFISRNLPCIIKNVSSSWDCTKKWITDKEINFDYLMQQYGELEAPVALCDNISFNAHEKINMKVFDYMKYLKKPSREKILYLKDWHLRRLKPNDIFYEIPIIFASDWLNEFAVDHNEDDFMFVYIGPKESWTPLHADVYSSYSWSVNIIGQKKWILFPPGEENKLKDAFGNLPLFYKPENVEGVKCFEIVQEQGDAIFVPSGWHHQVTNMFDTISINHNWINACNVEMVWKSLNNSLSAVENEIKEFKNTPEFTMQCQLILKSLFGMDFSYFINFVCYMAKKRLAQFYGNNYKGFCNFTLGRNHIMYDLHSILKIMKLIQTHPLRFEKQLSPSIDNGFDNVMHSIAAIITK